MYVYFWRNFTLKYFCTQLGRHFLVMIIHISKSFLILYLKLGKNLQVFVLNCEHYVELKINFDPFGFFFWPSICEK